MHPFRFAVQLRNAPSGQQWRATARKAEALGYSTLYIPDHFTDLWGPIAAITAAAEATTTLNVGALVFDNDYRHPVVLAKEIATLDILSEGRVEFGLGAGWMATDYEQSGITLYRPGVRIERMVEALEIYRQLFTQDTATFSGKHYSVTAVPGRPRPFTPGGPPILVGGGGRKVLTAAAQYASIIGIIPELTDGKGGIDAAKTAVLDRFHERIGWVREAAGSRFASIELQLLGQVEMILPNRDEIFEQLAPGFGLTPQQAAEAPVVLVGTEDQIVDDLIRRREELGFSYIVVHDLDAFAPIVARLAGT